MWKVLLVIGLMALCAGCSEDAGPVGADAVDQGDECPSQGTIACKGDSSLVCQQGDGRLVWVATACSRGCNAGKCIAGNSCNDECDGPGITGCSGNSLLICVDGDGCYQWAKVDSCSQGCEAGECVDDCVADCSGRECGNNGCGGSCGTCEGADSCNEDGLCAGEVAANVTGTLKYEARLIQADGNKFVLNKVDLLPALGVSVTVHAADGTLIGYGRTGRDGGFDVAVSKPLTGGESLLFVTALGQTVTGAPFFAVLKPPRGGEIAKFESEPYYWTAKVPVTGKVGNLTITEAQGSGAVFLFLYSLYAFNEVYDGLAGGLPSNLKSLAVMWLPGADWSCGACYWKTAVQTVKNSSVKFDSSIFLGGGSGGPSAWGWAVMLHEFGHYVALQYSKDDSPGGSHSLGNPVVPPFAWSEGWASFFAVSSMSRWLEQPLPIYWDIQGGTSFWIDYNSAVYVSNGQEVANIPIPANPSGGFNQSLDENWVVTMLWHIWDGSDEIDELDGFVYGKGDKAAVPMDVIYAGISSDRFLNFERGYEGADFVDFLDAIICQDKSEGQAISYTANALGFPYDLENCGCNATEYCN